MKIVPRLSSFERGDRVRLVRDCRSVQHGDEVFVVGECGSLGKLYRVQGGREVWSLLLDKKRPWFGRDLQISIAATHLDFEKAP